MNQPASAAHLAEQREVRLHRSPGICHHDIDITPSQKLQDISLGADCFNLVFL